VRGALQWPLPTVKPTSRYDLNQVLSTVQWPMATTVRAERPQGCCGQRKNADMAHRLLPAKRRGQATKIGIFAVYLLVTADAKGHTRARLCALAGGRAAEARLDDVSVPASAPSW